MLGIDLIQGNTIFLDKRELELGLDSRYVNVTGDTMTGELTMPNGGVDAHLGSSSNPHSVTLDQAYNAGGNTIIIDTDSVIWNTTAIAKPFEIQIEGATYFQVHKTGEGYKRVFSRGWVPIEDDTYDLGTYADIGLQKRWSTIHASFGLWNAAGDIYVGAKDGDIWLYPETAGKVVYSASFLPYTDNTYDLGNIVRTDYRWRNLYLSGDIGSSSNYVANIYSSKFYLNATAILDGATAGHLLFTGDLVPATDDIEWVGEIGSPFKAIKGLIIKDTTDGKHYSVTVVNGTLTTTVLD